jgi:hypothetical protein
MPFVSHWLALPLRMAGYLARIRMPPLMVLKILGHPQHPLTIFLKQGKVQK